MVSSAAPRGVLPALAGDAIHDAQNLVDGEWPGVDDRGRAARDRLRQRVDEAAAPFLQQPVPRVRAR
jgi:hypothetical protein